MSLTSEDGYDVYEVEGEITYSAVWYIEVPYGEDPKSYATKYPLDVDMIDRIHVEAFSWTKEEDEEEL